MLDLPLTVWKFQITESGMLKYCSKNCVTSCLASNSEELPPVNLHLMSMTYL